MFDLAYFETRKQELEFSFNKVKEEIISFKKSIKQRGLRLSELRGAYSECESNIAKLKLLENSLADAEQMAIDESNVSEAD